MGSENIHLCRICHSEFETEEDLSLHTCVEIKQEFQETNILDNYDVGQNGALAQDLKNYELPSNVKFNMDDEKPRKLCVCEICNKSFKDNYRLRRHISQVHTKDGEIIQPDQAPEPKTKIETQDARKLCICGICNKGFKDNYRLRRHESQVHTKDWNLIQTDHLFEPETKIETQDVQDFKDEGQFDFEYTDVDLSEEFLSGILKLIDELCDAIRNGDPDLERTLEVNENLNNSVSCYRHKLLFVDSKFDKNESNLPKC